MTTATRCAASPWVAGLLSGPLRPAEVLAAGPHAVYLQTEDGCLAVLGRDAVAVPIGLRTLLPTIAHPRRAAVGEGRVVLDDLVVAAARLVDVTVPALPGLAGVDTREWWDAARVDVPVPDAALLALGAGDASGLVGLGDGFTPVGDDVVCGWLVARHALGRSTDLDQLAHRTTSVSAAFLARAAAGEAIGQLRALLVAAGTHDAPRRVRRCLDDLLQVGSSSGAGLTLGATLALTPLERTP